MQEQNYWLVNVDWRTNKETATISKTVQEGTSEMKGAADNSDKEKYNQKILAKVGRLIMC